MTKIIELVTIVLSSTVFASIVNMIYVNRKNKYDKLVENVTNQRSNWRSNIKEIASKLNKFEFEDKKQLNEILHQLQMNINSNGYLQRHIYEKDGHIWNAIEYLKLAKNRKEFNRWKEVLLLEIDFLLKEDWERSKREIYGKVFNAWNVLGIIAIAIIHAILYITVSDEKDWTILVAEVVCLAGSSFFIPGELAISIFKKDKYHRDKTIRRLWKTRKFYKVWKVMKMFFCIFTMTLIYVFVYFVELARLQENTMYNENYEFVVTEPNSFLENKIYEEFEDRKQQLQKDGIENNNNTLSYEYLIISMRQLGVCYVLFVMIYILITLTYILYLMEKQWDSVRYRENIRRVQIQAGSFYVDEINELINKLEENNEKDQCGSRNPTECEMILRILYVKLDEIAKYIKESNYSRNQTIETYADIKKAVCCEEVYEEILEVLKEFGKRGRKLLPKRKKDIVITDEMIFKLKKIRLERLL